MTRLRKKSSGAASERDPERTRALMRTIGELAKRKKLPATITPEELAKEKQA